MDNHAQEANTQFENTDQYRPVEESSGGGNGNKRSKGLKIISFISVEVIVKTVILCLITTLLSHILLAINPATKESSRNILAQMTNDQADYTSREKMLINVIETNVHAYWMQTELPTLNYRVEPVFDYYIRHDMKQAVMADSSLVLTTADVNQERFAYYFVWLFRLVRGDFGFSKQGLPIIQELMSRLPTTLTIAFSGLALIVVLSIYSASISILRKDKLSKNQAFLFYGISSIPSFIIGYFFLRIFVAESFSGIMLIIPVISLLLSNGILAGLIAATRSSIQGEFTKNYVAFAYSKGFDENYIFKKHMFRNVLLSILPHFSQNMAFVVGGTLVIEKVFSLNGLADMLIDGLGSHDIARVLVVILVATLIVRIGSILFDMLAAAMNPKNS
jgi:ABC-type dipeptide/oligopeptide/nickel transport system permease component